jgi:polar amino acid transport system substrate-binding protein
MADSPVAAYIIKKSDGKLVQTGVDYGEAPYGIAINKKTKLTPAVHAAVQALISNGAYLTILKKWNLQDEAIATTKINDGIE